MQDNPSSVLPRKTNGELESHVIQLACGEAPEGHTRWTLEEARKSLKIRPGDVKKLNSEYN